ncbi:MAG: hypothetical protein KDD35_05100 [Bdellovibrionales bacterium]|nr:hypothetical protein [Bdellovibrionales bacterium]
MFVNRQLALFWVGVCFLIFVFPISAKARVFDFKNEYLASYLRGTAATSRAGRDAFGYSGGIDTLYEDEVAYNFSGEIGFLLRFRNIVTLRVGMEILQTKPLAEIPGNNASQVQRFSLNSNLLVLHPIGTLELDMLPSNESRLFIFAGAGLADATLENEYVMTATGTSELGGITDFTEKAVATQLSYHGGVGYERLLADTVTFSFELGYRYLPLPKFKLDKNVTTIAQGSASKNDVLLNGDGSRRSIDMSGPYASIGFRFYIDFTR